MALTSINIAKRFGQGVMGLAGTMAFGLAGAGFALAKEGLAEPWQMGLQSAATPVAEEIHWFHNVLLMPIITVISLFVLGLLVLVAMKFNANANKVPSQTTHHVGLEVAWTLLPVLVLVIIAIFSFPMLKHQLVIPKADLTLKITGHAWYWKFEYPKDAGGFEFEARMLTQEDVAKLVKDGKGKKEDYPRLLAVDNEAVVPVNKVIAVNVTAADVIHAFAVQSFGVKVDAVPGRMNQTWFKATREGLYYGQCQELCGKDHAFMPLAIRVVSEEKYKAWLAEAKKKFASTEPAIRTAETVISSR